jgi:Tfp pilus assembly protein PilZ
MSELRKQHRIVYAAKVRLRAPGREHSVVARVQNLSPRGIFITANDVPAAGTEVQCRLTIAGERRTLRGRVAWVRPLSQSTPLRSPGAGIEFLELEPHDADLLARLVEPTAGGKQPVDVWFEGMKAPIRCQAAVEGSGLRLSTRLPFMRLDSSVRVSFVQRGVEQIRLGTLTAVTLESSGEDGVPHLQLNVATPILDSAQGTIELEERGQERTMVDAVLDEAPTTVVDPAVAGPAPAVRTQIHTGVQDISDRDHTQRIELPSRPPFRLAPAPKAPPLVWPGLPAWLWAWLTRRDARAPLGIGFAIGALVAAVAVAALRPSRPPVLLPVVNAPGAGERARIEPLPAGASRSAARRSTNEGTVLARTTSAVPGRLAASASAAGTDIEDGLSLFGDETVTTAVLPVLGTTRGAQHYPLADPPGIAINLPRARPRVAAGVYRPGEGFRQLLIQRRGPGSHIRFLYDPDDHAPDVEIDRDAVRLVLRKK